MKKILSEAGLAITAVFGVLFLSGFLFRLPPFIAVAIFVVFLVCLPFTDLS